MKDKKQKVTFNVGDEVYDPKYGFGKIEKIDPDSEDLPYYGVFTGAQEDDVTKVWWSADKAVPADKAPKQKKQKSA